MTGAFTVATRLSKEYKAVQEFYGDRKAERSGVLLMQHIDDGLVVLDAIEASLHARKAFCLHPLLQADSDLKNTVHRLGPFWAFDPHSILLAMEYRNRANAWLSDKVGRFSRDPRVVSWKGEPTPGDLSEVRDMLIADKVQNYKDFRTYHKYRHPRSEELTQYFVRWFEALDVQPDQFRHLCDKIDEARL